jgi:ABC-2 type transport system permease protein
MRKYFQVAAITVQDSLVYRFETFFRTSLSLIQVLLALILWRAVLGKATEIAGYTLPMLVSYYVFVAFLSRANQSDRLSHELADDIASGKFIKYAVRPVSTLGYFVSASLAASAVGLVISLLGMALTASILWRSIVVPGPVSAAAAFLLWFVGLLFMILLDYLLALVAFWFVDVSGLFVLKANVIAFLAGVLIPLDFLPAPITHIMAYLPFEYLAYYPARLLVTGSLDGYGQALGTIAAWTGVFLLLCMALNRRAVGRFDAVGI